MNWKREPIQNAFRILADVHVAQGEGEPRERLHSFIDLVVLFDEDTSLELIEAIRPDVLAKGGDNSRETSHHAEAEKENEHGYGR